MLVVLTQHRIPVAERMPNESRFWFSTAGRAREIQLDVISGRAYKVAPLPIMSFHQVCQAGENCTTVCSRSTAPTPRMESCPSP